MSLKCQNFQTKLTFKRNVLTNSCDVRLIIIILCVISAILPIIKCAKLENPQIRLLINDDDLLQEKSNLHETGGPAAPRDVIQQHDQSGEHFNLYRSELKRLSYETIHRILRDENEPSYRREDTELRYYQKRSPSYEENHQLIKRSASEKSIELNLSQRNLTELLFTPEILNRLNHISIINLANNYLNRINISQLDNVTSLETLNLQNNSFTRIPLKQQTYLRSLNLNNNLIRSSSLNANIYLRNLFLSGNLIENLSSIPLSMLKNLECLDLSHNLLTTTESSFFTERMHNLKHLNLAFNQLGCIYRETFYNLLSLNTLLLSHNNITDIDYETFLALPNLQFLDLSFNNLQGKSIRALQGITGLVALNIAFNPDIGAYMQEFVASWSLKELDASGTGLCQIPAALAQSVRSLKLTHNWLKIINCGDLDSYPLLQYLDLSFSHIEHIEDDALGRLEILEILMLDHNRLRKIPFSLPVSLEHLFLQNNDIMEIPQLAFQNLNNLRTLDLSHNKLLYLPDIILPKLQTLNLQSSEIRGISQGIIHTLPKLNDLMLEDNPIKCSDLLGIAEWASTCRLRGEKEGVAEQTSEDDEEEENFILRVQNLKNKFEKMHNFYEKFGWNGSNFINETVLNFLKEPSCLQDNSNSLTAMAKVRKTGKEKETEEDNKLKSNLVLINTLKGIDFNLNSKTSTTISTNANKRKTAKEETKKLPNKKAVKTISIENSTQTLPTAKQSSILNGKQQISFTNPKSFYSTEATTTKSDATIISSVSKPFKMEGQKATEMVIQHRTPNEMKTFVHLTANPNNDDDDDDVAVTVMTTTTSQQDEFAAKGNITTTTKTSSNMTEIVEAVTKRTKETEQKQLKDIQDKTPFRKTIQTNKSKKWLKPEPPSSSTPLQPPDIEEVTKNRKILLKHNQSENINAAQFIKSTTFAMPINSEIPVTTTVILPQPATTFPTARPAALLTTTMTEAFIKKNRRDSANRNGTKIKEEKLVDVVGGFERTTNKLEINVQKENQQQQQQHEIKTKISTTKEIKSLAIKDPKNMQTNKRIAVATAASAETTTTTTTSISIEPPKTLKTRMILKIPPQLTANLNKPNKEFNGFIPSNFNETLTTTQTISTPKYVLEGKHEQTEIANIVAAKLKTFKTIVQQKPTAAAAAAAVDMESLAGGKVTTTLANSSFVKDKDLASNYNDNDNKRQITKTLNETNNISITTTPITTSRISSSIRTSGNNKNNQVAKIFDITNSSAAIDNNKNNNSNKTNNSDDDAVDQQQPHLVQNIILDYHRQFLQKDVNVKCIKTNSNECNSAATTQIPDELGKMPAIEEATMEQTTTASKTSTEISDANKTTTTTSSTVIHKHEPLQLLVKDRHLIGTPLLMHKGENLMVTADELILPTNNNKSEQEKYDNNKQHHDLETNTVANVNKYEIHLETSQTTGFLSAVTDTTIPNNNLLKDEHKINNSFNKSPTEDMGQQPKFSVVKPDDLVKIEKTNYETKLKKPSLIMKKMTIVTKQHEESHQKQQQEPLENEVHGKQFDNSHYQELKPLQHDSTQTQKHKHSTVNTPLNQDNAQPANLLKQPNTFQHEHDLLIQQILQDQQAETHAKLSQSEQWSDLRRAESEENHPGLILLVSSGLFLVLLLGLMHVYRCDMPWRRPSPTHHLRPHQRHNRSLEDDSHSFLSYSEGMQKWHHSTRLEAPYNSPLHNLHVRELQKTSATEKPATIKSTITNFRPPPLSRSLGLENSQSSTTTSSTASASSSAILDDESFYIEMTPDSGQFSRSLQSELLPMELLNKTQMSSLEHQEMAGESQTSMEDECIVHFHQQQRHLPHMNTSAVLPCSSANSAALLPPTMDGCSLKPSLQQPPRKFGLW